MRPIALVTTTLWLCDFQKKVPCEGGIGLTMRRAMLVRIVVRVKQRSMRWWDSGW